MKRDDFRQQFAGLEPGLSRSEVVARVLIYTSVIEGENDLRYRLVPVGSSWRFTPTEHAWLEFDHDGALLRIRTWDG